MSFRFNPDTGLIVIPARLWGPKGVYDVKLALDTGATGTLIKWSAAVYIGYDPAISLERTKLTTGSSVEYAPRIIISEIEAIEQRRKNFPILCHTLPPSARVDGVLGLDFFRGYKLTIDLKIGTIDIE